MTGTRKAIIAVTILGVVAVVAFVAWFLLREPPAEVDLEAAVTGAAGATTGAATETTATTEPTVTTAPATTAPTTTSAGTTTTAATTTTGATTTTAGDSEIASEWTVTNDIGDFSYEEASGTFVGFRIDEELQGIGNNVAVGRTPEVSGSLALDGGSVDSAEFTVEMSTITTNDSRRDDRTLEAMKVGEFPTATFELTSPVDIGSPPPLGETLTATAQGDMTIAGVTNPVEVPIDTQRTDRGLIVVGSFDINLSDYDVEVPQAPVVLSASDTATIEIQLWFQPVG